jgi:hypothetical protein
MRLNSISSPRCCQLWVIFWSKEALFTRANILWGTGLQYLLIMNLGWIIYDNRVVTKNSGFRMFFNRPEHTEHKKAQRLLGQWAIN